LLAPTFPVPGETWWEPATPPRAAPINLLDMRIGVESLDNWTATFWGKNVLDEEYNTEFSPGPAFLWPALPARYGLEFSKRF
jgi:iron complex outermembrane receptor protein